MSYWDPDFDEWMKKYPWGRPRFRLGVGTRDILWELEQMKKEMDRMFREQLEERPFESLKELVREYETAEGDKVREIGPIVYGYSLTIGPDGKPKIREFGNVKKLGAGLAAPKLSAEREPLADIIASDKGVKVVVELPGVEKNDIKINAREGSVEIFADTPGRKYHRDIDIPHEVDVTSAKTMYKNGILEIVFQRKPASESTQIKIE